LLDSEQAPAPVGFTMKAVKHEQVKAHFLCLHPERKEELFALESLPVFRGMLYNVNLEQHPYRLSDFRRAVEEIWSGQIEAGLIIRAWLTQGDYAPIFGWTNLGYKYFYGNDKEWATLLTHDGTDQVRQTLPTFLNSYLLAPGASPTDKLLYLIENWVTPNAQATDTWQYYFIKYEEMTSRLGEDFTGYYAWESENDKKTNFKIRLLNRTTLKGYHINPYVRTVALKLQDSQLAQVGKQFVKVIERSPLLLHESKVKLYSDEQGWQIKVSADYALPLEVAASFLLPLDVNGMQFLKSDSPDRIEVAVRFAEELHVAGLASLEKESEVSVA